jgi:hypothetical protein
MKELKKSLGIRVTGESLSETSHANRTENLSRTGHSKHFIVTADLLITYVLKIYMHFKYMKYKDILNKC